MLIVVFACSVAAGFPEMSIIRYSDVCFRDIYNLIYVLVSVERINT